MRKLVQVLLLVTGLLWSTAALAQYTTVTGTVTDPNGVPYAGGYGSINFVPASGAGFQSTFGGVPLSPTVYPIYKLDSTGALPSMSLPANTSITPSGSQWQYNICSASGATCFSVKITITGASQTITSNLAAAAVALPSTVVGNTTLTSGTFTETTAPAGLAASDILYGDSTAHRFKMLNNNGAGDTVVGAATTDTFTNKTMTSTTNVISVTDGYYWVPLQARGLTLTTGALGSSTTAQNPGIAFAAAGNMVLQVITSAAASAATLDCDISPPSRLTASHGITLTGVRVFYGYQGAAALSTISGPTINTVTYNAAGGAAAGTVGATAAGVLTTTAGTSHATPGAVTTTGQCYSELTTFGTPLLLNSDVVRVTLEEVFNHTTASAATYQICGVAVDYNNQIL